MYWHSISRLFRPGRLEPSEDREGKIVDDACQRLNLRRHSEIGRGSYGIVYKVVSKETDKEYALKVSPLKKDDERVTRYLQQEAMIQRQLDHDNVIRVANSLFTDDFVAIQMDLCEMNILQYTEQFGVDRVCPNGRVLKVLEEKALRPLARDILRGLVYIHHKGFFHRDIKPANILVVLDTRGRPIAKITDFGTAKETDYTASFVGSGGYEAPEVQHPSLSAKGYDKRCDVWSAGMTFFQLLTGSFANVDDLHPFNTRPESEGLSDCCRDLINSMLTWHFEKRFTSLQALSHPFVMPKIFVMDLLNPVRSFGRVRSLELGDTSFRKKNWSITWGDVAEVLGFGAVEDLMIITDKGRTVERDDPVEPPVDSDIHVLFVPRKTPIPRLDVNGVSAVCRSAIDQGEVMRSNITRVNFYLRELKARYQFCDMTFNRPYSFVNHCMPLLCFDWLQSELDKQQLALLRNRIEGLPLASFTRPERKEWKPVQASPEDEAELNTLANLVTRVIDSVEAKARECIGDFRQECCYLSVALREWKVVERCQCLKHAVDSFNSLLDSIREDVIVMGSLMDYITILKNAQIEGKYSNPKDVFRDLGAVLRRCPYLRWQQRIFCVVEPEGLGSSEQKGRAEELKARIREQKELLDNMREEFSRLQAMVNQKRDSSQRELLRLRTTKAILEDVLLSRGLSFGQFNTDGDDDDSFTPL